MVVILTFAFLFLYFSAHNSLCQSSQYNYIEIVKYHHLYSGLYLSNFCACSVVHYLHISLIADASLWERFSYGATLANSVSRSISLKIIG